MDQFAFSGYSMSNMLTCVVKRLDTDIANEVFCGELQDMLMLCAEVIRLNYSSFFKRIGTQFGSRHVGMQTEVPGTENMDTSI